MFARSPAIVLDSYSRRRTRRGLPRWLLLVLTGVLAGAGAVIGVQERWLPPRLSADESTRLTSAYEAADRERTQLRLQREDIARRLQLANDEVAALKQADAARQRTLSALRDDVATLVDALPPDPRGGAVQLRAARFRVDGGQLAWDIVLSRERGGDKPWKGVLQLVLTGKAAGNEAGTVKLDPVALTLGRHGSARGSQPLPAGFQPQQATVQVLDRPQGQVLGLRVWNLR